MHKLQLEVHGFLPTQFGAVGMFVLLQYHCLVRFHVLDFLQVLLVLSHKIHGVGRYDVGCVFQLH